MLGLENCIASSCLSCISISFMLWIQRTIRGEAEHEAHTAHKKPNSMSSPHKLDKNREVLTAGLTPPSATGRTISPSAERQTVMYELLCYWRYWDQIGPAAYCQTQATTIYPHQAGPPQTTPPLSSRQPLQSPLFSSLSLSLLYLLSFLHSSLTTVTPLSPLHCTAGQNCPLPRPISTQSPLRLPILFLSSPIQSIQSPIQPNIHRLPASSIWAHHRVPEQLVHSESGIII